MHRAVHGISGFLASFAVGVCMCGAFLLGCCLDFLKHPWPWVQDFWWVAIGLAICIRGAAREGKAARRR